MKKTLFTLALVALGGLSSSLSAQVVDISPKPHSITWGSEAFASPASYVITGGETADADAVALLSESLTIGTPAGYTKEWDLNGEKATLGVEKI